MTATKLIEKSGILPSDVNTPIPLSKRDSKVAELNAYLEQKNLLSDASYRTFEAARKNSDYRNIIKRDTDRIMSKLAHEAPPGHLKRSRDYEARYEDERDTKRPRDSRY